MGAHNKNSLQSKADQTVRISKSVFVSNFPEGYTAKDLLKVCNDYGTVVDVFIPNKKSKVRKRFAFVRFIKVINLDRLIENLNTVWIGRFHLFANLVCSERPKKPNLSPHNNATAASSYPRGVDQAKGQFQTWSYVNVVNGSSPVGVHGPFISSASVLVLDDSCVVERDLSNHVMGNVKDVSSISNLRTLIMEEGFSIVNLVYLGGLWVMIECDNVETKANMLQHTGVKSWFHVLQNGEAMDIEDNVDSSFGRKRLCIKTKLPLSILESFKEGPNDDRVSDVEEVSETNFVDNSSIHINHINELEKQQSEDPFNIYRLLRKQPGDESHKEISVVVNAKVMNNSQDVYKEDSCDNVDSNVVKKGGSILGVMEDMIRVGKAMGYSMDDCVKDLEQIIGTQGVGDVSRKRLLWDYVLTLIDRWNGEVVVMGDFNEVRNIDERRGSCFNLTSARVFDQFISASGLVDVKMEGYTFTWSHPLGSKLSKLDWFLVSEGIFSIFPSITAVCLDRHLSDHRPIILCEDLKVRIRAWIKDKRSSVSGEKDSIKKELSDIDRILDGGDVFDSNLLQRSELHRNLYNINQIESKEYLQKSKIKWAIEGDENSKNFHGLNNKKRSQLAIRVVFVDGIWCTNPNKIKEAFFKHFEARFKNSINHRLKINFLFSKRLSDVQASDLERRVSRDEIRLAVWNCGENKSPGPEGYSFEFFMKYWNLVGSDLCDAVEHFFETESFPNGCNSSFVALISKITDAKFVNDFRPISLIGSVYKVVTKMLANRLALKKKQVRFFKVDFAKAYDSVRWDYLVDVLEAFGFGNIWHKWIRGTFSSAKASVLVNGSPTIEFSFHCGLKQGDPLSPYLFILIMESLNMSFTRVIDEGVFKGVYLHGSTSISYLFYADDVMFIGEWSDDNLKGIINILQCFFLASGLKINIQKSQVLGVGVPTSIVMQAASSIGCGVLHKQFRYLGVMVGESIRSKFFNGMEPSTNKITWAAWNNVLASKENEGLASFIYSWEKAFILWIIVKNELKMAGIHVSGGNVAEKVQGVVSSSFGRPVRGGSEYQHLADLNSLMESVSLSDSCDRWICDLSGDGEFRVKEDVVKEIVSRLLEKEGASHFGKEKLEWWFEQDIDNEEERFEEMKMVVKYESWDDGEGDCKWTLGGGGVSHFGKEMMILEWMFCISILV
nr:hypothetical protein [Tanacetum cinerariifolium]